MARELIRRSISFIILLIAFQLLGCATEERPDVAPEIAQAASEPSSNTSAPSPDTTEADLAADSLAVPQPPPETAQGAPAAPQDVAPPELTQEPPPLPIQEAQENGPAANVTALDYRANENGGTVFIRTSQAIQYSTRHNPKTNQFIVELLNTKLPKKFRYPYDTKEFRGSIASINGYQGGANQARIVIQMRDSSQPSIAQSGNTISVAANGSMQSIPAPSVAANEFDTQSVPAQARASQAAPEPEEEDGNAVMNENERTMNDFLVGSTKFYGKPISVEVKDADIRDVFRLISEESGLNIIIGDEVAGKISLKLRKIPWDQALAVILQSKQLGYSKQGGILRIAPLKTLQAETDAARNVIESQRQLQPLRVRLYPISYAKAEDLEAQSKDFLSSRGKARADKRTNTLVVSDISEVLEKIKSLVQKLDTQTPQVLIEAKIVEARESFSRVIGVNWGFANSTGGHIGANSSGQNIDIIPTTTSGKSTSLGDGLTADLRIGTFDVIGDLSASLRLLETEELIKIISAPRIVTLDRVDAMIEQTTQFPLTSSIVAPNGTTSTSVSFQSVKLQLTVTPQITAEGGVIMKVTIVREFPGAIIQTSTAQARSVNTRQAQTQVLVENGDTVVIGGIYSSDVSDSESGIPWLRKIPLFGALFRQTTTSRDKNELVIFLTPRILNKEKAFLKAEGS